MPPTSGVEATYRFTIEDRVPARLTAVVKRPDLWTVLCNDRPVEAAKGQWRLDRAFGIIDIRRQARVGEKVLVPKAAPFTIYHEIEPVYLLGNFALDGSGSGFVIAPDRAIGLAPWNEEGRPFYSEGVTYTETLSVEKTQAGYRVQLKRWYGSVGRAAMPW